MVKTRQDYGQNNKKLTLFNFIIIIQFIELFIEVELLGMNFIHKTVKFFDKLEDKVRARLSRKPIIYTLIGAVAIVLFWRGIWMLADKIPFLNGWVSTILSIVILLMTGLFVSFFIGEQVLISGLKQEKKLTEKTEEEIKGEEVILEEIDNHLEKIEKDIKELKNK